MWHKVVQRVRDGVLGEIDVVIGFGYIAALQLKRAAPDRRTGLSELLVPVLLVAALARL